MSKPICDRCGYLVQCGKTEYQRIFTKYQRGGRGIHYCHHPKVLSSHIYNFVGYSSAKPPCILTIKTCKRWCPRRSEDK